MSITNEQKQRYLDQRRYFYAASPNYYGTKKSSDDAKKKKEEESRQKKLLNYLNQAKKSAIKRGMYNQKTYNATVSEAKNNV